jgi:tetratricopeptide (TPR) repeat protein
MATSIKTQAKPLSNRKSTAANDDGLERLQLFYEKNKKLINGVVTGVLVLGIAIFAYFKLYLEPREDKASSKVFYAQQYFAADSLQLALQGDGQHPGFVKIARDYSGTKTANLSHYYAGVCYLRLGNFKSAIKQLEDFNAKGTLLATSAAGALGNAYLESGNTKKAIEHFKDATTDEKDVVQTPLYLAELGAAYEINKQPQEAIGAYKRIRDEFPMSMQAREIDHTLARLGVLD